MTIETPYSSISEETTLAWAKKFTTQLKAGDVIGLKGDLGTGKTVICKGICQEWGFEGNVTSPTYSLIQEYPCTPKIIHMDFYRVSHPEEYHEIGLDYYLNQNHLCLIEWPEKIAGYPIHFTYMINIKASSEEQRIISLEKF